MPYPTQHCRTCGRPVIWTKTEKGTPQPIDPEPNAAGNTVLHLGDDGDVHSMVLKKADVALRERAIAANELFMPHHATCPQGRDWQRRTAPKRGADAC